MRNDVVRVKHMFPFANTTTMMNPVVEAVADPKFPGAGKPVEGGKNPGKDEGTGPAAGPGVGTGAGRGLNG